MAAAVRVIAAATSSRVYPSHTMGLSAIDTKSAHGVPRHEVLGKRWLSQPVLIAATSFGEVAAAITVEGTKWRWLFILMDRQP
jgi:hypothetical protein